MATHPSLDTKKPLGLSLNRESAAILLRGLEGLPPEEHKTVLYDKLKHDLNTVIVIWDRRIKNERLVQERKRALHIQRKDAKEQQRQANRRVIPRRTPEPAEEQPPEN